MFFILLFGLVYGKAEQVCNISAPISQWLANNTGPCDAVKGHFILDKAANKYTREIFSTFSNLKRIEGCIYVREFTGSQNLSFFGNLEEVICPKKDAKSANLSHVIDIRAGSLNKMGFDSLRNVEGPGEIIISFEQDYLYRADKCFSKHELLFLIYHPQFKQNVYPACETNDPCLRQDLFQGYSTLEVIPDNCTIYVGYLCIIGLYEYDDPIIQKFQNLTLLIGRLIIMGTFFSNLKDVLPNLQMIYPYNVPHLFFPYTGNLCLTGDPHLDTVTDAAQYLHVGVNRFLEDISLPALLPTRPIDVTVPPVSFIKNWFWLDFDMSTFLPDTIQDRCQYFPQFKPSDCGYFTGSSGYDVFTVPTARGYFSYELWLATMISTALGLVFSLRALILLAFSHARHCLPFSRLFIVFIILVALLVALESCLYYQKAIVTPFREQKTFFLSEFDTPHLVHPLFQRLMAVIATLKHLCLVVIVCSHLDIILFYRTRSTRLSLYYCSFMAAVLFTSLYFYLSSQLYVTVRGRAPHYSQEWRPIVFMPFLMNVAKKETFEIVIPSTHFMNYANYILSVPIDNMSLEILGEALPTFSAVCDGLMLTSTLSFVTLRWLKVIVTHHNYDLLPLLYLQLSINRLRWFIYDTVLVEDYCRRKIPKYDMPRGAYVDEFPSCHDNYIPWIDPFMTRETWDFLEMILEKLYYISYPIVSFVCWRFARYHSYLGPALTFRDIRQSCGCRKKGDSQERDSDVDLKS